MGLYTQRAQGIPGGKTAVLEPEELEDALLHAAGPHRRRRADQRAAAGRSPASAPSSAATSPTSPTGRTCSCTGSASRTSRRSGGGSRRSACRRPRPAATPRASCSAARWPASLADEVVDASDVLRRDGREVRRRPGVLQPAAQVQDLDLRLRDHCTDHEINDVSFVGVVGRRRRGRLRPVGRRRPVDQPEVRPAARRLRPPRPGHRGVGRRSPRSSATTATAGSATTPG